MVEPSSGPSPSPSPTSRSAGGAALAFERAKRRLVLACVVIACGLATAASFDRTTGGVLLLVGWALAIASLHHLGRSGSDRGQSDTTG